MLVWVHVWTCKLQPVYLDRCIHVGHFLFSLQDLGQSEGFKKKSRWVEKFDFRICMRTFWYGESHGRTERMGRQQLKEDRIAIGNGEGDADEKDDVWSLWMNNFRTWRDSQRTGDDYSSGVYCIGFIIIRSSSSIGQELMHKFRLKRGCVGFTWLDA